MSAIIESYPKLREAVTIMGCSNLMIRRDRSEADFLRSTDKIIGKPDYHLHLAEIEAFAAGLTEAELETVADGEHSEQEAICARDPMGALLNGLLNDIFEEG